MDRVVFWVTDGLSAAPVVALGAALLWGVLSVLLSPCHLGTIPLVVGMVGSSKRDATGRGQGALLSFSFAGGMLVAIALLGVAVSMAGFAVAGLSEVTNYVVATIFLAAGLYLIGLLPLPLPSSTPRVGKRKGAGAAAGIGLVFGLGLSPCTFAFIAPILGVSFSSAAASPFRGMALLFAFGVGHCGVVALAGSSTDLVQRCLDWNEQSRAVTVLKSISGVLVLLAAGVLVYTA